MFVIHFYNASFEENVRQISILMIERFYIFTFLCIVFMIPGLHSQNYLPIKRLQVDMVRRINKMHTFFVNDSIQLYCFRHAFEQLNVHHREVCTSSFAVFYHAPISSPVAVRICLIPQTPPDSDQTAYMNA